jgi:hypothetical protein
MTARLDRLEAIRDQLRVLMQEYPDARGLVLRIDRELRDEEHRLGVYPPRALQDPKPATRATRMLGLARMALMPEAWANLAAKPPSQRALEAALFIMALHGDRSPARAEQDALSNPEEALDVVGLAQRLDALVNGTQEQA